MLHGWVEELPSFSFICRVSWSTKQLFWRLLAMSASVIMMMLVVLQADWVAVMLFLRC